MTIEADVAVAAADDAVVSTPDAGTDAPIENAPAPAEKPDAELTPRNAVARAMKAVADRESGEPAKEEPNKDANRNPDGTFKAKDTAQPDTSAKPDAAKPTTQNNFAEPPARLSADAKAAWANVPEPVRADVHRAVREMEGGIQQYQKDFEPYKDFDRQLKQNGQSFQEVLGQYTGIEKMLATDPIKGLDTICQNLGYSLREVAAHVLGQAPDQNAQQNDRVVRELNQKIAGLERQLGGVTTSMRSQQESAIAQSIDAFSAEHPRFEELSGDIAFFIQSGRTQDLKEAYELAERLNPAPAASQPVPPATRQPDPAQTRNKGALSVTGAPASGSNPRSNGAVPSIRDAIRSARAATG